MTNIAGFERIGPGIDGQHQIDEVAHRDVGRVRPMPAAPAQMEADAVLRQAAECVIERLDPDHRKLLVVLHRRLGIDHVPSRGGGRVVELQDQPGIQDRLIFLAQGLGAGVQELFVGFVIFIRDPISAAGRDSGHKPLLDPGSFEGGLEICDVGGDLGVARVGEWADADRAAGGPRSHPDARLAVGISRREPHAVPPIGGAGQRDFPGAGALRRPGIQGRPAQLEPAQTTERVVPPCAITDSVTHRFAQLAVAGNIDTELALMAHDIRHRGSKHPLKNVHVNRLPRFTSSIRRD